MGFKGNRGPLIIGVVFILILIVIVAAASSSGSPSTIQNIPEGTISVTVKNSIGVDQIVICNLNTGKNFTFSLISLPAQFNCTRGDYLQIQVVTRPGYTWNGWWFNPMGIFDNDNPAILAADSTNPFGDIVSKNQIVMTPNCLMLSQQTPAPTDNTAPTWGPSK